ncbi:ferredoxin [Candidatus Omnitrophus magneticus]|uniref:Ferredoxin n=1 Tax=Candidatus Omnitrophus magneticus TaxID=1609969 RepID=A0A0F0CL47_9BACT|nr:ferredoxin [Candidatus Omnitrophus magneticus]
MKAVIDKEACIGCGLCVQIAPSVYKMDGEKAVVSGQQIAQANLEDARTAMDQCPVAAITIS